MPPMPAARLSDMTQHGGTIIPPNAIKTIIEMVPAARLGDMHLCPMVTPGLPPIPHVGGPIIMGSPTVLIEFLPAARVMDPCVCVGPPDMIAMGAMKTMIGEGGGAMSSIAPPAPPSPPDMSSLSAPAPPPIPGAAGFPAAGVAMSAPAALCTTEGDPVDVATGRVFAAVEEFTTPGEPSVTFTRFYSSAEAAKDGPLGFGWRHNLIDWFEIGEPYFVWHDAEGRRVLFPQIEVGGHLNHMDEGVTITRPGPNEFVLTDSAGKERHFTGSGTVLRLTGMRDAVGRELRTEYGIGPGNLPLLLAITDSLGNRYRLEYGGGVRLTAIALRPANVTTERLLARYEYDTAGNLITAYDALEQPTRYRYDDRHRLTQRITRNGHGFYFQYDALNRCTRAWAEGGLADQTFIYNEAEPETVVRDAATGSQATYRYNELGLVTEVMDRAGATTSTQYQGFRALRVTDPLGRTRVTGHDGAGRVIAAQSPGGNSAHVMYSPEGMPSFLDAHGHFTQTTLIVPEADTEPARIEVRHDSLPDPLLVITATAATENALAFTDPTGAITTLAYDTQDRLAGLGLPGGAHYRYEYDTSGRLSVLHGPVREDGTQASVRFAYDSLSRLARVIRSGADMESETAFAYDPEGNLTVYRDANGSVTRFEHRHPLGRLTAVTDPTGVLTRFDYDATGNLASVVDGRGNSTRFSADNAGHIRRVDYPGGATARREYDEAGQLVALADRGASAPVRLEYDADGRLGALRAPATDTAPSLTLSFAYDECGRLIAAEGDEGADSTCAWEYDDLGRLTGETQNGQRITYGYDAANRLASLTLPSGKTTRFAYDTNGRVMRVTDTDGGEHRFRYSTDGSRAEHRFPNGLVARYGTTPLGLPQLETVARPGSSTPLWTTHFVYDGNDALTEATDSERGRRAFHYDAAGRLLSVDRTEGGRREEFAYDAAGNALTTGEQTIAFDAANRIQSTAGIRHDACGRITDILAEDLTLAYDALGRLCRTGRAGEPATEYRYDALGRRTAKRCGETETLYFWAGDTLVAEETREKSVNLERREYLYLPDTFTPLSVRVNDTPFYCHNNFRDAPTRLSDIQGRIVWAAEYTAWGQAIPDRSASQRQPDPHLRLPGQYHDEETGLHYNRHRYYHPSWGRYLSPDPLGYAGGSLNLYIYAGNDPINEADPLGLTPANDGKGKTLGSSAGHAAGPKGTAVQSASALPPSAAAATASSAAQVPPTPKPGPPPPTTAPETPPPSGSAPCAKSESQTGSGAKAVASQVANFVPVVGDAKGIAEGIAGKDLVTGSPMGMGDRALSAALGVAGLLTLGAAGVLAKGGAKALRVLQEAKALKAAKLVEEALQTARAAEKAKLLEDLVKAGIKHTPADVLQIARRADNTLVFLEKGSEKAGFAHFHLEDFANRGYRTEQEVQEVVMKAMTEGKPVGIVGRDRTVYQVVNAKGEVDHLAVQVSKNGFIVGANPVSSWKPLP